MSEDFLKEELRGDYMVSVKEKKIWAAELKILRLFDKICRENGLKYFAAYGTLLGAIRHSGYIPWDDDLDVFMLRDDYAKFVNLASECISYPYELQGTDNGYKISPHAKLRDASTTAIEFPEAPAQYNQGIFIDIFPLDDANDGKENRPLYFEIKKLMWQIATYPNEMLKLVSYGQKFVLDSELICDLVNVGPFETLKQLELFNSDVYGQSQKLSFLTSEMYDADYTFEREWFEGTKEVEFEDMMIPVPIGYDSVLKRIYGENYMTPIRTDAGHSLIVVDPDKPYTEYLKN